MFVLSASFEKTSLCEQDIELLTQVSNFSQIKNCFKCIHAGVIEKVVHREGPVQPLSQSPQFTASFADLRVGRSLPTSDSKRIERDPAPPTTNGELARFINDFLSGRT